MPRRERALVLSCEHGGNRVPREYRDLFAGREAWLDSHRGWDAGALSVARGMARRTGAPLVAATTTRLLVDLNRSPHNPAVWSALTRPLPRDERAELLARYHQPHWERVRRAVAASRVPVLHVAVHSFTPVWKGAARRCSIGILYRSRRPRERALASDWQRRLRERLPGAAIRRNAPYRGGADGLTTALRRELPSDRYLGVELELNQQVIGAASRRRDLVALLASTLLAAWEAIPSTAGGGVRRLL